jgi:glucose uptake protein GlcU
MGLYIIILNLILIIIKKWRTNMKKVLGTIAIVMMLISISQVIPAMETEFEKENINEEDLLNLKLFAAIGIVNINKQSNVIRGYVLVGYNSGEILSFEMVNIGFQGNPITLSHSIFTTICLYEPA